MHISKNFPNRNYMFNSGLLLILTKMTLPNKERTMFLTVPAEAQISQKVDG